MSDQIKHESLKTWLESNPKKVRKIMRKTVILLLYLHYSIWCIKNSKECVDKKTFYKYITSETITPIEWCWLKSCSSHVVVPCNS